MEGPRWTGAPQCVRYISFNLTLTQQPPTEEPSNLLRAEAPVTSSLSDPPVMYPQRTREMYC